MADNTSYPSMIDFYKFSEQRHLAPFHVTKKFTRWNALNKYRKNENDWQIFTCTNCPNPWPNTTRRDPYTNEWIWENTKRCSPCNKEELSYRAFKKWFELIDNLAEEKGQDIYFGSVSRGHSFIGDAHEIRDASVEATIEIVKDFKKMIHKKSKNLWNLFNSGLVLGELKWRRPGDPVYDTSSDWYYNGLAMECADEPMRYAEEYEAHPHAHFIGLTPKVKMPYRKLNSIAAEHNMNVHFERISSGKAKRYLSRYFGKDKPTRIDGTSPRIRGKTGDLFGYKGKTPVPLRSPLENSIG